MRVHLPLLHWGILQQIQVLKHPSDASTRLSGEHQTKAGMLMRPPSLSKAFFYFFALLCCTPGIFQKVPVWQKLLAALKLCVEWIRLLLGLPNISILHQVSAFTLACISTGFLTPSVSEKRAPPVPSWAKRSEDEAVFVHAFTRVAAVSHAPCSEIETGI